MASATILVTGANGQVGRACIARLRAEDVNVIAVSRDGMGGREAADLSLPFEQGLARLEERKVPLPQAIVHLAAAVPHDPRYPDGVASATMTRAIDRHVYRAAQAWDCRVIYISTCALYDRADLNVKGPQVPLARGLSPYADAKRQGEQLFATHDAAILRLSAPAGAHSRSNLVFGRFAERCRAGAPIELWGTGRREQDFIHLDDVCDLILCASASHRGGIHNCASGRAVTMVELAEAMMLFYGRGSITFAAKPDPLEGETARYDIESAKHGFAWAPMRGLTEMLTSYERARNDGRVAADRPLENTKGS